MQDTKGRILEIDPNELQPNPLQPRGLIMPDSLNELVDSIKTHGILEPLVVAHTPAGYQIIAGERRWRASKQAGFKKVPIIVKETTPRGMLEMALVENVQREDLNPLERGQAYMRLMEEFGLTNQEIAKRVSKSPSYISNSIKLLYVPDSLKDALLSGLVSEGHVRALGAIEDAKLMVEALKIILKENGSVRRAEDLARRFRTQGTSKNFVADNQKSAFLISEEIDKMKSELEEKLSANVKLLRSKRETKVLIRIKGSIEDTEDTFRKIYKVLSSL